MLQVNDKTIEALSSVAERRLGLQHHEVVLTYLGKHAVFTEAVGGEVKKRREITSYRGLGRLSQISCRRGSQLQRIMPEVLGRVRNLHDLFQRCNEAVKTLFTGIQRRRCS